jgi:hypothetical protein
VCGFLFFFTKVFWIGLEKIRILSVLEPVDLVSDSESNPSLIQKVKMILKKMEKKVKKFKVLMSLMLALDS